MILFGLLPACCSTGTESENPGPVRSEPKGECTKNYIDKQKSGTKDLTLDTAKKRLSGREKQIADALKDAGA